MKLKHPFCIGLALCALLLSACEKNSTEDPAPPEPVEEIIEYVMVQPLKYPGVDTNGNSISAYALYRLDINRNKEIVNQFNASQSQGIYTVKYVPSIDFFDPEVPYSRGGQFIYYKLKPELLNTILFEVYDADNKLFKKYRAANDSLIFDINFSTWGDNTTPSKRIGDAYLYYLKEKTKSDIKYRKHS